MRVMPAALFPLLVAATLGPAKTQAFDLFIAREPVYAVVDGELFVGEARARIDRSGTLAIRSTLDPQLRCTGHFHFLNGAGGEARLRCSDGNEARLEFEALGIASGHGSGETPRGRVHFAFGLSPGKAAAWLALPAGTSLVKTPDGLRLQTQKPSS
ncbi:MAG: hypothetical protein RLZZ393_541 [Pseudomonadota bacterium]|jgi:hypothetical protein